MSRENKKILFITEDFPSGLNGNSVRTKGLLEHFLKTGYKIDLCCLHFEGFKIHQFKHKNLRVYLVESNLIKKTLANFYINFFKIIFSFFTITLRRLFNKDLNDKLAKLLHKNSYDAVFYDGYSTLQYLDHQVNAEKIYIDDEDFTDLFRQRFLLERNILKRIFYLHEYLKSSIYELYFLRKLNQIWAISPRTKKRLEKASRVKTVIMPTIISSMENLYSNSGTRIVFTGTLNWRENIEGLKWFISNHWNNILKLVPDAKLLVIGQGASTEFISYLNSFNNIIYKGYVKNLKDEYAKSCLSIAPVRINAGIKVKILTYMSYGLPVVSTNIASLGLVSTDGVLISPDKSFAKYIIILLRNQNIRKRFSKMAHSNIKNNYSDQEMENFLSNNFNNNLS